MVNAEVRPLLQGGQDDNLTTDTMEEDNLFALAEWGEETKERKLHRVGDPLARNLLAQMLHKDPRARPSLSRVLAHPFISGKKVARLPGDEPQYDVFLSYRVASDTEHVRRMYELLTSQGYRVYWDVKCLAPGVDWEQGFCEGLVSSRAFVPLLSGDAINHPSKDFQNFGKLTAASKCDNVYLEYRLAVELQGLGVIEKIYPIFIGTTNMATGEYSNYFASGCHPALPEVAVQSVEAKLRHHMSNQHLGSPLEPDRTVASVVNAITACQGAFVEGPADAAFLSAATKIRKMLGTRWDVFLSYRVAADGRDTAHRHVERLYELLTAEGLKVYWDVKCLAPGVDWEQGFCEGLVSSRAFVPLLSGDAINHPEKDWQNFGKLTAASKCDNVYLEHRFALELKVRVLCCDTMPYIVWIL